VALALSSKRCEVRCSYFVVTLDNNEHGSVMVVAVMMVALLWIIGIAANYLASIEVQIAGNERTYQENFYLAESAALEGVQRISNPINAPLSHSESWLKEENEVDFIHKREVWEDQNNRASASVDNLSDPCFDDTVDRNSDSNIYFAANYRGKPPGASLKTTNVYQEHAYSVYGLYQSESAGEALIEIGFKR